MKSSSLGNPLNLPNLLCYVRLLLSPFLLLLVINQDYRRAVLLVAVAALTDAFDGMLARRFGWETRLGTYLDPIADKLMLVTLYMSLGVVSKLPGWLVWLVVGRDFWILTMAGVAYFFTRYRDYPPSVWGKINTVLQVFTAFIVLGESAWEGSVPPSARSALIAVTGVSAIWSGLHYTARAWRMLYPQKTVSN